MIDLNELIIQNELLIYSIINRYKDYFDIEDLYQTAVIGLINAYKNYKDDKQTKISSYAYFYMKGEVKKYIRESIRGGRCMTSNNEKIIVEDEVVDFDACSLYPSAMSRLYLPKGDIKSSDNENEIKDLFFNNVFSVYLKLCQNISLLSPFLLILRIHRLM